MDKHSKTTPQQAGAPPSTIPSSSTKKRKAVTIATSEQEVSGHCIDCFIPWYSHSFVAFASQAVSKSSQVGGDNGAVSSSKKEGKKVKLAVEPNGGASSEASKRVRFGKPQAKGKIGR